jgi:CheY-like chemotaxis protein
MYKAMDIAVPPLFFESARKETTQIEICPPIQMERMDISVLVVEDDRINYRLLECILKMMITKVEHATNGLIAIDLVSKNHYDLIFMDMNMPVMGGIEATIILKKLYPKLPIIALSASLLDEDINSTLQAGCDAFLFKPTKRELVREVIQKYVYC